MLYSSNMGYKDERRKRYMLPTNPGEIARFLMAPNTREDALAELKTHGFVINPQIVEIPSEDQLAVAVITPLLPIPEHPTWYDDSRQLKFETFPDEALPALLSLLIEK